MRKTGVFLLVLGLAGCASRPAPPQSEPTEAEYTSMARSWVRTSQCADRGMMPLETAAIGRHYLNESIDSRGFDRGRLSLMMPRLADQEVYQPECSSLALNILEAREQRTAQQAAASAPAQTYMPKFSTCNRVFGQVNCTTY